MKQTIQVALDQRSYFVDIGFQGNEPIKLSGDGAANCAATLTEDRLNPIYGGVVYPKKVQLQCPKPR